MSYILGVLHEVRKINAQEECLMSTSAHFIPINTQRISIKFYIGESKTKNCQTSVCSKFIRYLTLQEAQIELNRISQNCITV
jgi:hypothetical protein